MYGGSSKLGRGGAAARGGAAKRPHSSFPPPPSNRPSGGRLSLGGGPRNRPGGAEETFTLIPGKSPLAFGMIIRLAPDLVDEIRRVESQGETPRIKFDSNANNTNGNVIDVGGKEFRFTWSRELADLCDIYEQRRSGEDGNGLLVDSGSAWRKVNVQRVLDESTTNHVKMRSEEAERKLKSRKAIILDHGNPSMKNQIKALAAVETSQWRKFKQKKEPPMKKQKVEPPLGGPPKPTFKSGLASTTAAKSRRSASPLPSPPDQFGAPASPSGTARIAKSHLNIEEVMPSQMTNKENATSSEKETLSKAQETPIHQGIFGARPKDLQSLLITLLTENPKGMSLKALEKAVGDTIPNSAKKIEPIIRKIATSQASGRYILKPGVDESFSKPSPDGGSSSEGNRHQTPAPEVNEKPASEDKYDLTPARESIFDGKVPTDGLEEQAQLNMAGDELDSTEDIDILQHSPNLGGERKGSGHNDRQDGSSSSESESDSESESSDSGSDSKSRSQSPAGNGSSSDSESDASSNSKEGSDEDVDIMTSDDDKEPKHKSQASEPGFSTLPNPWGTLDGMNVQNGIDEKQDARIRDVVEDVEKDIFGEGHEAEMPSIPSSVPHQGSEKHLDETKSISSDRDESRDRHNIIERLFEDEENTVKESFKLEKCASSERISKGKSRRGSDSNHLDWKSEHVKRLKAENLAQPPESHHSLSPGGTTEFGMQKGYNQAVPVKSSSDFDHLGRRSNDQSTQAKAHDTTGKSDKHAEFLGHGRKYSDKSAQQESLLILKDKAYRDSSNEDGYGSEMKAPSSSKEISGGKYLVPSDSHHRKYNDVAGKFKDSGQVPNSHIQSSPINNRSGVERSPHVNGRGSFLQRELSDLELGELREPMPEEPPPKKQFERKSSFKQSENKLHTSENSNLDSSRGKSVGRTTLDSIRPSPSNYNSGVCSSLEGLNRKKTPEHVEDVIRSHHRAVQSQGQNVSRADHAEVGFQYNRLSDFSSKSRQKESAAVQGIRMEGYGESHKKAPACGPQYHDTGRGGGSCSPYSKYEKDKPELKGPIKDFSQYNEYVQEYSEKYGNYCSLNKILERDRNEFQKFGKDLEFAKDRDIDRYRNILAKLKESYQQCGERHKRMKKIFSVLHEELKHLKQRIKDFALSYTKD